MKCLTGFIRKGSTRIGSSEIRIADRINDLGAMVEAIAPKLF